MNKILIVLCLIPFSLSGMNKNIPNELVPIVTGLHYNLAARIDCAKKGIPSKENDPFIQINIYQGSDKYTENLSVPLSMLLDKEGKVKEQIFLYNYSKTPFKIVSPHILQNNLLNIVIIFNNMNYAYYTYEEKELIAKNIIHKDIHGKITHVNGGYELPCIKKLEELYGNPLINSPSTKKTDLNHDTTIISSKWIIGIGTLGLIGLLIWLYKNK